MVIPIGTQETHLLDQMVKTNMHISIDMPRVAIPNIRVTPIE